MKALGHLVGLWLAILTLPKKPNFEQEDASNKEEECCQESQSCYGEIYDG